MKKYGFFILLLLFASCEKTLNLSLNSSSNKMVVEGVIERGQVPYVVLSNSMGFFSRIDLNSLQYIKGAVVTITDLNTSKSITLREYSIDTTIGQETFSFTLYGPDITDTEAMNFKGQEEHFYKLHITSAMGESEAITKVPTVVNIDSFWLEPVPGDEDKFKLLKGRYADPDTFGNSLHYQTQNKKYKKTGEPEIFYDPFVVAYDDAVINGTTFPITFDLGFNRNHTYPDGEGFNQGYLRKGDTVTLKYSSIDRAVYRFYEGLDQSRNSVGNPFATPLKIQGNVSNALGVWAGFGTQYFTIIDSLK
jgi:hypothetical protein